MAEPIFKSSLSTEEIENNFKNIDFFPVLWKSWRKHSLLKKEKQVTKPLYAKKSLPDVNVSEVRKTLDMTQKSFAAMISVSSRTVEAWECGKSTPTPTAKKLIYLIQNDRSLVDKLLVR